jgi:putative ABC transport system permease protein
VEAITARLGGLAIVSGTENASATIVYGAQNWSTSITGVERPYFTARKLRLAEGRIFTEAEERAGNPVCVVGETVRRELFGQANPVGSRIRVKQFGCQVVGLLSASGQAAMGDPDDVVLMPLRTVQRRLSGSQDVGIIMIAVADAEATDQVKAELTELLRERRRIARNENDNFSILDTRQIAEAMSGTTRVMTMLLASVAAVSLLVGGIGIMNIMLVSVTERTHEIGIRLAIGALERDVLLQFLIEAVTLSAFGGILGAALAAVASVILAQVMNVPFVFDPGINLLAFFVSAAIGVGVREFAAPRAAPPAPHRARRHP